MQQQVTHIQSKSRNLHERVGEITEAGEIPKDLPPLGGHGTSVCRDEDGSPRCAHSFALDATFPLLCMQGIWDSGRSG